MQIKGFRLLWAREPYSVRRTSVGYIVKGPRGFYVVSPTLDMCRQSGLLPCRGFAFGRGKKCRHQKIVQLGHDWIRVQRLNQQKAELVVQLARITTELDEVTARCADLLGTVEPWEMQQEATA